MELKPTKGLWIDHHCKALSEQSAACRERLATRWLGRSVVRLSDVLYLDGHCDLAIRLSQIANTLSLDKVIEIRDVLGKSWLTLLESESTRYTRSRQLLGTFMAAFDEEYPIGAVKASYLALASAWFSDCIELEQRLQSIELADARDAM